MKIYISLWKICVRGQTTPQKKPKFSQDPSECFVDFFEGELRQRCSYTGSFRQCSLSLFISRRTFFFFVDFVIYFSNIYTAFQVSMLISNKKSSKHENLNVTLFAARLHYDTFQSERHLKDLLTRHWSLKQRATKLKIKLNSFDGTKMSIQKLRWHSTGFFSKLWQTNTLLVSKSWNFSFSSYREWNFYNWWNRFLFSNYFLTFSVASVKHFNPSCCMIVRVRFVSSKKDYCRSQRPMFSNLSRSHRQS